MILPVFQKMWKGFSGCTTSVLLFNTLEYKSHPKIRSTFEVKIKDRTTKHLNQTITALCQHALRAKETNDVQCGMEISYFIKLYVTDCAAPLNRNHDS